MDAFKALDAEGLFGTGKTREQLLLIIITEDTEKSWAKPSAKLLNPPAVFERFEADTKVEGIFMASDAIAFSQDERSLYSAGGKNPTSNADDMISEIVAYDFADLRLKRRWEFVFPASGDSGRAIACSRDGKTILVMRARYGVKGCQTLLMRFGRNKNKIIQQAQITGEPIGFAVSSDDSRVAVPMNDGPKQSLLHVLDGKLSALAVLQLPARARHLKFLGSSDLLAATDAGIFRIDPNFKITDTPFKDKCLRLSLDDKESVAVVGLGYDMMGFARNKDSQTEIGCKLLRLPSFETARELKFPDLIVQQPVITPDGRHIAFHAQKIKTYKCFTVVCEAETGREIARQEAGFTNDLKFLRDNRTLVIARSGSTTTEPVVFWRVPGL